MIRRWIVSFVLLLAFQSFVCLSFAYTVSGKVSRPDGSGVSGVTISFRSLKLAVPQSIQTSSTGAWSQKGFEDGQTYTATPSKEGFSFTPTLLNFSAVRTDLNFTATPPTFSRGGRVTNTLGNGVPGVSIRFSVSGRPAPASVQTDGSGRWSQSGFETGLQYSASAAADLMSFNPQGILFTQAGPDMNFTVTSFVVVGQVRTAGGGVFPGVTLSFSCVANCSGVSAPSPVTTNSLGNWAGHFSLGPTWKATPSHGDDIFQPDEITFTTPSSNLNFTSAN